jgi:predicted SAM-dependent methyltransferase
MRLDIGCGAKKEEDWIGIDSRDINGVDIVHDLETFPWPIEDETCQEVKAFHILEHLEKRKFFSLDSPCVMSEIWRILKPSGILEIAFPPAETEAYHSDPTHVNPLSPLQFRHMDPTLDQYENYRPPFRFRIHDMTYDSVEQEMKMVLIKYE